MRRRAVWVAALWTLLVPGRSWAADPVAYLTEIQAKGSAEVRVRPAGEGDWRVARPLQALRPGDQLEVRGEARAVVLFHAGGTTRTITPADSPLTIAAPPTPGGGVELSQVMASVNRFLLGRQEVPRLRRLAARGLAMTPRILAPRQTRLFPGPTTFEWEGHEELRYTLRVIGPQGVVWRQTNLPRGPVVYPATAPPLTPGVPYHWELEAPGFTTERAQFEILTDAEAARVGAALAVLDGAPGNSPGTLVVMRVALLFEEGLYDDARRRIEAAVLARPDDPTLRLLQGHVYQRVGLLEKALDAFDRAASSPR
jgi:hypothetical protein